MEKSLVLDFDNLTGSELEKCINRETLLIQAKRKPWRLTGQNDNIYPDTKSPDGKSESNDMTHVIQMKFSAWSLSPERRASKKGAKYRRKGLRMRAKERGELERELSQICFHYQFNYLPNYPVKLDASDDDSDLTTVSDDYNGDISDITDDNYTPNGTDGGGDCLSHMGYRLSKLTKRDSAAKDGNSSGSGSDEAPTEGQRRRNPNQRRTDKQNKKSAMMHLAFLGGIGAGGSGGGRRGDESTTDVTLHLTDPSGEPTVKETTTTELEHTEDEHADEEKTPKVKKRTLTTSASGHTVKTLRSAQQHLHRKSHIHKSLIHMQSHQTTSANRHYQKSEAPSDKPAKEDLPGRLTVPPNAMANIAPPQPTESSDALARWKSHSKSMENILAMKLHTWNPKVVVPRSSQAVRTESVDIVSQYKPVGAPVEQVKSAEKRDDMAIFHKEVPAHVQNEHFQNRSILDDLGTKRRLLFHRVEVDTSAKPPHTDIVSSVDQVYHFKRERDNEWLRWAKDNDEEDDHSPDVERTDSNPIQADLDDFLQAQSQLTKVMGYFGVYPYDHETKLNGCVQVIWKPSSVKVIALAIMTSLYFICGLSLVASIYFKFHQSQAHTSLEDKKILNSEYQKYVIECFWVLSALVFVVVWGTTALFEMGCHYAEFMTRFNYSICLLKYNVSQKIDGLISSRLRYHCIFSAIFLLFFIFGENSFPMIHEACGVVGHFILRPVTPKLRVEPEYEIAKWFGLFVVMLSNVGMILIMLQLMVYGKAIENMARTFSARMTYRLRGSEHLEETGEYFQKMRNIPYEKLYAEGLIIASLFRHISNVNSVVLFMYLVVTGCQTFLFLYGNLRYFNSTLSQNSSYESSPYQDLDVPLRFSESRLELVLGNLVYLTLFLMSSYLFVNTLTHSGHIFRVGVDHIRKYGLMYCHSANERRFVLSMMRINNPKQPYVIGQQYGLSRPFVFGFLVVIVTLCAVVTTYSGGRTDLRKLTYCSSTGVCSTVTIQRGMNVRLPAEDRRFPPLPTTPVTTVPTSTRRTTKRRTTTTTTTTTPPPPTPPPTTTGIPPILVPIDTTSYSIPAQWVPCGLVLLFDGSVPNLESALFTKCSSVPNSEHKYNFTIIPHVYHLTKDLEIDSTVYTPHYRKLTRTAKCSKHFFQSYDVTTLKNQYRSNYAICQNTQLRHVHYQTPDDCGNPPADTFNPVTRKLEASTVELVESPGWMKTYVPIFSHDKLPLNYICCYVYASSPLGYKNCNVPRGERLSDNCERTFGPSSNQKANEFDHMLTKYQAKVRKLGLTKLTIQKNATIRNDWKLCVCRERVDLEHPNKGNDRCNELYKKYGRD